MSSNRHLTLAAAVCAALLLSERAVAQANATNFHDLARESLAQIEGTIDLPGLRDQVQVLRDRWGVAHIYANNQDDLFYAQGYVQAQDRLWQIDMWRRVNEGRLAEILGPEGVAHDRLARLVKFRGPWEPEWTSYHPDGKRIFEAFANGVNAFIDEIGDNLPVEYKLTGLTPLRWTPEASVGRVATALPLSDARDDLRLARQVAQQGYDAVNRREGPRYANWIDLEAIPGVDYSIIPEAAIDVLGDFDAGFPEPPLLPEYRALPGAVASLNLGALETSPGSNNWVVSGELTRSGEVLLANDPHRGVTNPSLRYLVHLNAPGYSVVGSTEPSIPGVAIGHNGHIGWGLTIVGTDQADVFVERLSDDLSQAMYDGSWYPLRTVVDTIQVRGQAPQIVQHKYSRHGPLFYIDSTNRLGYAVRSTASEPGTGGYLAALRLAEAEDCQDFIDVMAYYFSPTENMLCGDVDGNIAWLAAALTPRRTEGWHGRLPVPGTGEFEWEGFRSHTELPQEFNPDRGWIATANHDIQPPGYFPPLMFVAGPFSRWDRLQQMFASPGGFTVEDFERMQNDAFHPWWEDDRPFFVGWRADDPLVEWARVQVADWDGNYHRSSPAAALHNIWRRELEDAARQASTGTAQRQALSQAALAEAVSTLRRTQGDDRTGWRWGRIHRSEFPHWLVSAYDLPSVERSGGGGSVAATGATFREIIDFSDFDNSRTTNTPGQSAQPGSPFYGNLLAPWGNGQYFPLLYTREAVEPETTHRLTLTPGN